MRFNMIDTRLIAHGPFLQQLHGQGRERAAAWLRDGSADIGRRSSIDVKALFD